MIIDRKSKKKVILKRYIKIFIYFCGAIVKRFDKKYYEETEFFIRYHALSHADRMLKHDRQQRGC
jgi:hypothetical protein